MPLRPSNGKISRPDLAITGLKWHFHSDGGAITGPKWHLLSGFVSLRDRTWIVGDELILLKFNLYLSAACRWSNRPFTWGAIFR